MKISKPYTLTTETFQNIGSEAVRLYLREPYLFYEKQIDDLISNIKTPKPWYAGLFEQIANKLDGIESDEVTLDNARKSLEFVTAVYYSSRKGQNISLPIKNDNPLYNSWLP